MPETEAKRNIEPADECKFTEKTWMEEGEKRFGNDRFKWYFKCPGCGNIQCPEEFRQFKDKGATPNSAYQQCIGRFVGGRRAFGKREKGEKDQPCDYTINGLFAISKTFVFRADSGEWQPVFDFATKEEVEQKLKGA